MNAARFSRPAPSAIAGMSVLYTDPVHGDRARSLI